LLRLRSSDLGSLPTLAAHGVASLIISAWWLRTSSKFGGKKSKETTGKF